MKHWVVPQWWHRADGLSKCLSPHPSLLLTNMQPERDSMSTINIAGEAQTPAFPVIALDIV